ncbi:hypothetical protein COOONC_22396 [Cooperia oncophora]
MHEAVHIEICIRNASTSSRTVRANANLVNERINIKCFKRTSAPCVSKAYSLAERYQISENIKTCKSFKLVVLSIMGFNMVCIGAVAIDNFEVTILVKNVANTALNYSALMFGFTVPLVSLYCNSLWQSELKHIFKKILPKREDNDRTVRIMSTFGKDMVVSNAECSQRYFEMLQKEW